MIRLSSASPRNSRRSLCGLPALRCRSAWSSRLPSTKAWPSKTAGSRRSGCRATLGQVLGRRELTDHIQVVDHRLADFVIDIHLPAVVDALDLDVLGLHVLRVADVQPAEEQVLDLGRILVGDAVL